MIVILNKADLVPDISSVLLADLPEEIRVMSLSAKHKDGLSELRKQLIAFASLPDLSQTDIVVSNVRHYEALVRALESIHRVQEGLSMHLSGDFISQDLRECLHHLGEIVGGSIETDEVLGNIFKNFCIGK